MADKDETQNAPDMATPRMIFLGVTFMVFVWVTIMVIVPAITGKPGVVQKMQSDLQNSDTPTPPSK